MSIPNFAIVDGEAASQMFDGTVEPCCGDGLMLTHDADGATKAECLGCWKVVAL